MDHSLGTAAAMAIHRGIAGTELHHFDQSLDQVIDFPAVIAGNAAQKDTQEQAHEHADQADGQRNARAVEHTAEQVMPHPVGAPQIEGLGGILRPEKMDVRFKQAQNLYGSR